MLFHHLKFLIPLLLIVILFSGHSQIQAETLIPCDFNTRLSECGNELNYVCVKFDWKNITYENKCWACYDVLTLSYEEGQCSITPLHYCKDQISM